MVSGSRSARQVKPALPSQGSRDVVVITIYNRRGVPEVVRAIPVSQYLAVHRAMEGDGKGWMLSHIPTGLAVYQRPIYRKRAALKAARAIAALACWDFNDVNHRPGKAVGRKVEEIADGHR